MACSYLKLVHELPSKDQAWGWVQDIACFGLSHQALFVESEVQQVYLISWFEGLIVQPSYHTSLSFF